MMTDEEKAEEYANRTYYTEYDNWSLSEQIDISEEIKKAYLDGLAEGKPKWHDLRKNPNDLPKNREYVLLYVKLNGKWKRNVILIGYRDYGDCLGEYCEDWGYVEPIRGCSYDFVDGEEVIAWCELPQFKE